MESFFASLKTERVHEAQFRTRAEARAAVFEYIEVFYNRQRLHCKERWTHEHRLAAEALQREALVSTHVAHLRSKEHVRQRLEGERARNAKL